MCDPDDVEEPTDVYPDNEDFIYIGEARYNEEEVRELIDRLRAWLNAKDGYDI